MKGITLPLLPLLACWLSSTLAAPISQISSPNNGLSVIVDLNDKGQLSYQLLRNTIPLMQPSRLGISLNNTAFVDGLILEGLATPLTISEHYQLKTGKVSEVDYLANEQRLHFQGLACETAKVFNFSKSGFYYDTAQI
jgi:hypothetical protein